MYRTVHSACDGGLLLQQTRQGSWLLNFQLLRHPLTWGAADMAKQIRAVAALAEDLGLITNTGTNVR